MEWESADEVATAATAHHAPAREGAKSEERRTTSKRDGNGNRLYGRCDKDVARKEEEKRERKKRKKVRTNNSEAQRPVTTTTPAICLIRRTSHRKDDDRAILDIYFCAVLSRRHWSLPLVPSPLRASGRAGDAV